MRRKEGEGVSECRETDSAKYKSKRKCLFIIIIINNNNNNKEGVRATHVFKGCGAG